MPNTAIIGAALTDHSAHPYGLFVAGIDVIRFTPLESITVTENGPGSVSSMSWVIEDHDSVVAIPAAGSEVVFYDFALDYRVFAGYVQDYTAEPVDIGRMISVNAVGMEILLDWASLVSTSVNSDTGVAASDLNPLELPLGFANFITLWFQDFGLVAPAPNSISDPVNGDATHPIGTLKAAGLNPNLTANANPPVPTGTLRSMLEFMIRNAHMGTNPLTTVNVDAVVTVDFYRGLRVFYRNSRPNDWTDLTISDTYAGANVATSLQYEVHPGDVPRAVYVIGGNAAGTGWVTDGTNIIGQHATLNAPNSTSAGMLARAGAEYLASQAALVHGTLTLEGYSPTVGTIHPMSTITITDANVGLSATAYQIASITKTFIAGGKQNWEIAFGGRRPSYIEDQSRQYSTDTRASNSLLGGVRN